MRFIIRHLSPYIRSRRRFPFVLIISLLICTAIILYTIDYKPPTIDSVPNHEQKFIPAVNVPTSTIIQKYVCKALGGFNEILILSWFRKGLWPLDEKGRSLKTDFLALDLTGFFGSGADEGAHVRCPSSNSTFSWTRQQNRVDEADFMISHDAHGGEGLFKNMRLNSERQQYSMAFIMESEVHSSTGGAWTKFNFKMSYNLDDSYPEPATYFDTNIHIIDLLKPPEISFEDKEKNADIVWIISNCNVSVSYR